MFIGHFPVLIESFEFSICRDVDLGGGGMQYFGLNQLESIQGLCELQSSMNSVILIGGKNYNCMSF